MSDSIPCKNCTRSTENLETRTCHLCQEYISLHGTEPNGYCHVCEDSIFTTLEGRATCPTCNRDWNK